MRVKLLAILLMLVSVLLVSKVLAGEDDIRQAFTALQKAIKGRDADKIWGLIDTDSQADANRAAKAVQAAFAKADDKGKGEFEKKYGLTAKELGAMTGKLFIKSERFHGKYYEVPGGKIESVKVKGDTARITFKEEDGDIEKFSMVKQKGEWRFTIPMPKAVE
jgi:hypothetical protein